jgi:hypothetical protein
MDSSGLFSHPDRQEAVYNSDTPDPVQPLAFSDRDSPPNESQRS